jgi:hypothetical protein
MISERDCRMMLRIAQRDPAGMSFVYEPAGMSIVYRLNTMRISRHVLKKQSKRYLQLGGAPYGSCPCEYP